MNDIVNPPKPRFRSIDLFAEYLAEGYRPDEAANLMGQPPKSGHAMLERIKSELGAQAR